MGNLLNINKDKRGLSSGKGLTFRRVTIALILFTIVFVTILYGVSTYGRNFAASDPMLDPMKNPNIMVADVDPGAGVAGGAVGDGAGGGGVVGGPAVAAAAGVM